MLWSSVALTTWIGTVTSPNEMAPDQMVRGMPSLRDEPEKASLRASAPSGTRCAGRSRPAVRMRIRAGRASLKPCPESRT